MLGWLAIQALSGCSSARSDTGVPRLSCCAGLDEEACEADAGCQTLVGWREGTVGCRDYKGSRYAGCRSLGVEGAPLCNDALTWAMDPATGTCWLVGTSCWPDGWVACADPERWDETSCDTGAPALSAGEE
jgi:hypothetical protein